MPINSGIIFHPLQQTFSENKRVLFMEDTKASIFKKNIVSIHGDKGQLWLSELPNLIADLKKRWRLSRLTELDNLSYNYVLSGFKGNHSVVLKLGVDHRALEREAMALECFANYGANS